MKYILPLFVMLFSVPAFASDPAEGLWLTENERAVIEVQECDRGLCGAVYWIIEGGMQYDEHNPDESKRTTPMCSLEILYGFKQKKSGEWSGGKIYKADEGDTYNANVRVENMDTLKLRGYVGVPLLGKTQSWKRVDGADYPQCQPPA